MLDKVFGHVVLSIEIHVFQLWKISYYLRFNVHAFYSAHIYNGTCLWNPTNIKLVQFLKEKRIQSINNTFWYTRHQQYFMKQLVVCCYHKGI